MPIRRLSSWCCLAIATWQLLLSTAITLHHRHEGGGTAHHHRGPAAIAARETPLSEPAHAHLILLGFEFFLGEEEEGAPTPATTAAYALEMGYRPAGQADHDRPAIADFNVVDVAFLEPMTLFLDPAIAPFATRTDQTHPPAASVALLATDDVLRI
jgi:hypothetical protein